MVLSSACMASTGQVYWIGMVKEGGVDVSRIELPW
jgi:hypothetical protein